MSEYVEGVRRGIDKLKEASQEDWNVDQSEVLSVLHEVLEAMLPAEKEDCHHEWKFTGKSADEKTDNLICRNCGITDTAPAPGSYNPESKHGG